MEVNVNEPKNVKVNSKLWEYKQTERALDINSRNLTLKFISITIFILAKVNKLGEIINHIYV